MVVYLLPKKIIELSKANTWDRAKQEWVLHDIVDYDYYEYNCLCGHPIKELCILKNKYNGKETIVGNCCVKKFLKHFNSERIFSSIKRVKKEINKSFNTDFIQIAHDKGIITDWEYDFYMNIWCKQNRQLAKKQLLKKIEINKKILCSKNLFVDT